MQTPAKSKINANSCLERQNDLSCIPSEKKRSSSTVGPAFELPARPTPAATRETLRDSGAKPVFVAPSLPNSTIDLASPSGVDRTLDILNGINETPPAKSTSETEDKQLEVLRAGLEEVVAAGARSLDRDISAAPKFLSGEELARFTREAEDTKAILSGMNRVVFLTKYATLASSVAAADSAYDRDLASGQITWEFAKDLAGKGVEKVLPKILGPEAAAVLLGPAAWVGAVIVDVSSPQSTGLDDPEIIRDRSGRFTLSEKQSALRRMWNQERKFGKNWGAGQRQLLMEMTQSVYDQAK